MASMWERQLVAFGMLLADKELRQRLTGFDFHDAGLRDAVGELRELTPQQQAFPKMMKVLWSLGFEWSDSDKPVDAIIDKIKLDADWARLTLELLGLAEEISETRTDGQKRLMIERVKAGFTCDGTVNEVEQQQRDEARPDDRPLSRQGARKQ